MEKPPYSQIEKGTLLIATPEVGTGLFHRAVILLCEHNINGSFGIVINKELDIELPEELINVDQVANLTRRTHLQQGIDIPGIVRRQAVLEQDVVDDHIVTFRQIRVLLYARDRAGYGLFGNPHLPAREAPYLVTGGDEGILQTLGCETPMTADENAAPYHDISLITRSRTGRAGVP